MTILIVDSSVHIIDRLESLVLEGDPQLIIHKATICAAALRLFDEFNPEVVVLDLNMPAEKPCELLKQMKEKSNETCIIALSAPVFADSGDQYKQTGADHYLDKYNEFDKISGIIKSIVENNDRHFPDIPDKTD